MPNQNLVIIAGHITRDPELRFTTNGAALVQFGIAVNKKFTKDGEKKEIVTFVDCKAWREHAEYIGDNFRKGDGITVTGELTTEAWDDKATGAKRSKTLVLVSSAAICPKAEKGEEGTPRQPSTTNPPTPEEKDDVPF